MKMKTKIVVSILLCLVLTVPASAMGSTGRKLDHGPLIKAVDTNKDGRMSLEEWQTAGLPMSSFNGLNQDGYVTEKIMLEGDAPDGIDINGDGVLMLEEFLEFDKIMSQKMAAGGGPDGPPPGVDNRPVISDAERALAMWQVQNVMSKHAYYHAAGLNSEEIAAIWVDSKGPNAETATFASPGWKMSGLKTIQALYGDVNQQNREKALEAISKVKPEIENISENLGAGHEWAMHTNTTPIIEVAGDGKTAKGIWYSPGMGLSADIRGDKVGARGTFFWEKYGADFAKENGVWKIWHLQMAYDFTPAIDQKWLTFGDERTGGPPPDGPPPGGPPGGMAEAGERMDSAAGPPGMGKPDYSYPPYSPERKSIIYPPFPEPYYTFSETFSY